jgi:hypothetical protein
MAHPPVSAKNKLLALGIMECLMVLPATFALSVAVLRMLQPRQFEPARTGWAVFEWMTAHLTKVHAAAMFLVLPATAIAIGSTALLRSWREDELLRWDAIAFLAVLRRNVHVVMLTAGAFAGAAILLAAIVHMITN